MKISNYVAVFLLLLGIAVLSIAELSYSPLEIPPGDIDKDVLGERVITEGRIEKIVRLEDVVFFELKENPDLKIVKFTSGTEREENEVVVIEGEVDMYQGDVEIKVEEIRTKEAKQLSSGL